MLFIPCIKQVILFNLKTVYFFTCALNWCDLRFNLVFNLLKDPINIICFTHNFKNTIFLNLKLYVSGRDGSRAFVTGDFTEEGLTDDVDSLNAQELRSLNDWLKFYRKEYIFKGKYSNCNTGTIVL